MTATVTCPNPQCAKSYQVSVDYIGRRGRCKSCGTEFVFSDTNSAIDASVASRSILQSALSQSGSHPGTTRSGRTQTPTRLGRFQIQERVGMGGFGAVYRAQDPQLQRTVALKLLQTTGDGSRDRHRINRFLIEGRAGARLQHPNIVPVFDAGKDEETGEYYMAAAFITGAPLSSAIDGKPLDLRRAAKIVSQLARALDYAHAQGILHRDVKPDNVMLDEQDVPHLMDFGLARMEESESHLTRDGTVMGTPSYMSPEQCVGKQEALGPAADQYSLGCLLYELLTGDKLFEGPVPVQIHHQINTEAPPPSKKNAAIPPDLDTICLKTLTKEPERRYASCAELAADLERWLADEPIHARQLTPWERWDRWRRRNPTIARLSLGLAATLLLGMVGITTQWIRAESHARAALLAAAEERKAKDAAKDALQKEAAAHIAEREAKRTAELAQIEAEERLNRLHIATGVQAQERGDPFNALQWYAKAWADDKDSSNEFAHRSRIGSTLFGIPELMGVCFHEDCVDDVAISRDGTLLVTRCRDRDGKGESEARLWDYRRSTLAVPPLTHTGPVHDVGFSPDGTLVLTTSDDKTAVLWDAKTGQRRFTLKHDHPVLDAAFSADGSVIATAAGKQAMLWSTQSGMRTGVACDLPGRVIVVEFAANADRLLAGADDGSLRVWTPSSGQPAGPVIRWNPSKGAETVFFKKRPVLSPDGNRVVVPQGKLRCVAADTGNVVWEGPMNPGQQYQWSRDGRWVAAAAGNQLLLESGTGRKIYGHAFARSASYTAISPDGKFLACATTGGDINIVSPANGTTLFPTIRCASYPRRIAFSADSQYLVAASEDGTARVWRVGGTLNAQTEPYRYDCGCAHLPVMDGGQSASPDGRTRFMPNPKGGLRTTGNQSVELPHPAQVTLSRFNGRGDKLATFAGGIVRVWPASGPVAQSIELQSVPNLAPTRLDISDDGETVMAVTVGDPKAVVWSVKSRAVLFQLPNRIDCGPQIFRDDSVNGIVNDAVLSPDGTLVVAGVESSGELMVYDVATGRRLGAGVAFRGFLFDLAVTADSRGAIPLGSDLTAREFELPSIKPVGPVLRQPDWPKRFLAISPSGRQLATMTRANDPRLRIWDLKTGDVLASISPSFPVDPPAWFNSDATALQFKSGGSYRRLRLPVYTGARDAVPLAVRIVTGRYLDETGGIADIPQDEYRNDPATFRDAWLKWRSAQ